jgi:1,4-dihydroxy-2-naphthoate octaprenyltransferase
MRHSGPRIVFRHPTIALRHLARKWGIPVLWRLLRPHTLTASFVPVFIGSALALNAGFFRLDLAAAMLLASLLIQSAVNMFNEYYDYERGLDNKESVGIGGAIVRDGMQSKTVLSIAVLLIGLALTVGIYIMLNSSWRILPWGLACMTVGYLYSGGPYPLSSTPFGEIAAGSCMGFGIIAIAFFIHVQALTPLVYLASFPPSLLIGAILMANNIRDFDKDRNHGRKTLAILLGKPGAVKALAAMFILSQAWVVFLVTFDQLSFGTLLVSLSIPKMVRSIRGFQAGNTSLAMMPAMIATAQANSQFGILFALGILLGNR